MLVFSAALWAGEGEAVLPGSGQPVEQVWLEAWQRSSEEPASFVNRLVLSDSAYLKQHARNPIDWYPYTDAAFAKAEQQNKLILLSIGYASCHWCHVMEAESFSDLDIAESLNQNFVAIKVDREQSPDVDAYYTMVVETVKGESGWPMTVVLTPDRRPVFAANYLSKTQLLTVLDRLSSSWQNSPQALQANADLLSGEIERRSQIRTVAYEKPKVAWEVTAQDNLLAGIDKTNGGFGHQNKFPSELKLQFLLNAYRADKRPQLKGELVKQLDRLMNSGLNDIVFGGVFRYTTDPEISRPHFEKMLYNQALTVTLFEEASAWLDKPVYKQYAATIIEFVNQSMQLDDGSFAAAIDADHAGVEGGYYLWPAGVLEDLPKGVESIAIGEGSYYLYGPAMNDDPGDWKARLRQSRDAPPARIDNRITAWNALWISALLAADQPDAAGSLAETVWASTWDGKLLHRMPGQPGFLDDYSYFSAALWQLYLKTGDINWKAKAKALDQALLNRFYHQGVLSYSADRSGTFAVDIYQDRELPSAAAAALKVLAYHQTEVDYLEAYQNIQNTAFAQIANSPEFFLTLVQQNFFYPTPENVFAKGHGLISLQPTEQPTRWQLVIKLDPDWHVNANRVNDSSLIPLRVSSKDHEITVNYPESTTLSADFSDSPLNIFSDETIIDIQSPGAQNQALLRVQLQACSDRICLLPEQINLESRQ